MIYLHNNVFIQAFEELMKFKIAIFSILLYLTSFLSTMVFISSSAMFVNHIGAASVAKIILIFGITTPIIVFALQKIYSVIQKYEYVFILYILAFILCLFFAGYIKDYSNSLSYWLFYIIGYSGYSLSKIVSWSLIGRYFNVIDSRRYFATLTAFQEFGSISSALLIKFVLVNANIINYTKISLFILAGIFAIFLFLLTPTAQAFKANKNYKQFQEQTQNKINYIKFLNKHNAFMMLGGMFIITVIFEQVLIYELNMTFSKEFNSIVLISSAFAIYKMCESSFVIFSNLFLSRVMNRYLKLGNILIIYSIIMLFAITMLNMSEFWLLVPIASFLRHSSRYFMFMPSYEQALNSLDSKMRIALKSFFEGFLVPIFICVVGFCLMAFPTHNKMSALNIVLLLIAAFAVVVTFLFKKKYISFHIERLSSDSRDLVIKSVQALGENKNNEAVEPLMDLLTQAESTIVKKNIILSFGRIKINDLLKTLFQEAKNEHEELQKAAFESLSKYNSFLVQRFLIDLIHGETCRSLSSRMSLLQILYNSLGNAMVPILLPYLQDKDARIIANTIEAMEPINDSRIIEILAPFFHHPNRRIKGNVVIVLHKFPKMRKTCDEILQELYNSEDEMDKNTFLYIIGRLRLKNYKKYLKNFIGKSCYRLNLALAYCKLEEQQGYELFADLLINEDEESIKGYLHHFSQLEDGVKLRILSVYMHKIENEEQKQILLHALKHSCFEFHEARDYLKISHLSYL